MNAEEMAKRFLEVARCWGPGLTVWHRADGQRGVVVQYVVCEDGRVMLEVAFGNGKMDRCVPLELSAVPVGEGGDGEEWKIGA